MEPDPTQGAVTGATATPPATPSADPSTTSTVPATAGGEPQTADPGRAVGDDFNHPVYGPKLKNFQKGLEEKARALKEVEEKHGTVTKQIADLNARLQTKPELLNEVRALYGLPPLPTAKTADPDPDQGTQTKQELARWRAEQAVEQAILEKQLELGRGDLAKGREVYGQHATPAFEIMKSFDEGDARTRLNLAMEFHLLRSAQRATPPPATTTNGLPATEMSRGGTNQASASEEPTTPEAVLRKLGMTPAQYMSAVGAFD